MIDVGVPSGVDQRHIKLAHHVAYLCDGFRVAAFHVNDIDATVSEFGNEDPAFIYIRRQMIDPARNGSQRNGSLRHKRCYIAAGLSLAASGRDEQESDCQVS